MPSLEDLTTDQLLATAKQWQGPAALIEQLSKDPANRLELQRLVKKVRPDLPMPELDARDAVRAEMDEQKKTVEKLQGEILEERVRRRLEDQRKQIKDQYKLTDADVAEVEKMMVDTDPDKRIPGYDAAARVFVASKTQATPTPSAIMPPVWEMPESKDWKAGIGNPAKLNQIGLKQAFDAWNEITGGKAAA